MGHTSLRPSDALNKILSHLLEIGIWALTYRHPERSEGSRLT